MDAEKELIEQIGRENVIIDPDEIKKYMEREGDKPFGEPQYVVYASDTNDIKKVIDIANQNKISVVPASSSVHFYGPCVPFHSGIVLDLSRMKRIENIDQRNRKVKIEAGVTWSQIQSVLEEQGFMIVSPLFAHPERSVLTDYLERTPPVISLFEFAEPLLGMEVVWPNGDVFRTGSASVPNYPHSIAEGANPQGPAAMDYYRILQCAQGTMGIVSWANIKIEFIPGIDKTFFISFKDIEEAVEPIYRIQRRRIGMECLLLNKINFMKILSEKFGANPKIMSKNLPPWILILVLSGFKRRPLEKIDYEEKALKEITSELLLNISEGFPGAAGIERQIPALLRKPWDGATYWKLSDNLKCKDLFFITTLNHIKSFYKAISEILLKYEFPLDGVGFYIQPIEHGRACHFEVNLYYDEKIYKGSIEEIFIDLATNLLDRGAHFTRPYGELSKLVYKRAYAYTKVLKEIKRVMDPNHIMCPGALCF
jgi:FAD/FMN-containing dehydrogenase